MDIVNTRESFYADGTIGRLTIDGVPVGYVVEDRDRGLASTDGLDHIRAVKVPGETAIPTGRYRVHLYDSPKHGPDTPELLDVPGYDHIQVHAGNVPADTLGCQVIGRTRAPDRPAVYQSRDLVAEVKLRIVAAIKAGHEVWYTVARASGTGFVA